MTSPVNPVVHRSKLFNGATAAEVYASVLFRGKRCTGCGAGKCVLRIQTYLALKDLDAAIRHGVVLAGVKLMVESNAWPITALKDGPGIRVSEAFACAACRAEAERTAARLPSYQVVVFDRLPDDDKPMVSVASSLILATSVP